MAVMKPDSSSDRIEVREYLQSLADQALPEGHSRQLFALKVRKSVPEVLYGDRSKISELLLNFMQYAAENVCPDESHIEMHCSQEVCPDSDAMV